MVWHCEDCHQVGFYFDKTEREVAEEHAKTCEATRAALAREDDPSLPLPEDEDGVRKGRTSWKSEL